MSFSDQKTMQGGYLEEVKLFSAFEISAVFSLSDDVVQHCPAVQLKEHCHTPVYPEWSIEGSPLKLMYSVMTGEMLSGFSFLKTKQIASRFAPTF